MPAIFISHSSLDPREADDIKSSLARLGFERVFLDFDKATGIDAGENWEKRLYEELSRCHAVILVLTPNWVASKWCFAELTQARALGKVILPIICKPLGERFVLPDIQAVDLLDWNKGGLERLEQRLRAITNELARGFALDPNRPPYPGIHAFEAEDAAIYFGRDDETRAVIERLDARRTQGGARLLLVIGASGSGKSSLLKAGVLPQLSRRRGHWLPLPVTRPERTPLEAVAKAIAHHLGAPDAWEDWHRRLGGAGPPDEVEKLLKNLRVGDARAATVLLPIDQFEEVFTVAGPDERAAFLRLLAGVLDPARNLPVMVIATGRSDVLEGLIEMGELARLSEAVPLAPMPLDRVPRLVEGPAAVAGLNVEKGLAERIAHDVESPEALPLLAQALALLHRSGSREKRLTIAEYVALGDAERALNPIQNSVRLAADRAITGLRPAPADAEMVALRDAFVPHLVRVRLDDGKRVRQPARITELPQDALRLIRALVEARLLTTRDELVEVAHEALFKAWPTLDQWLTEEQAFLTDRERIRDAHHIWAQALPDQKAGALLHGLLLSRTRDWLLKYPQRFLGSGIEPVRAFIAASAAADDARTSRARTIRRRLFQATAAAAVVFAAIAAVAGWQYFAAEQARRVAERAEAAARENETRALAALSTVAARDGAFTDSIYLALAGWPRTAADPRPRLPALLDGLALGLMTLVPIRGEFRHDATVRGALLSRDETRILSWSRDKTLRLWDVATGRQIGPAMTHDGEVNGAQLSRDEARVLSWSDDGTVRLWDVATGRQIGPLMKHYAVRGAQLTRDGTRILSWSHGYVRLWDVATGHEIGPMTHTDEINGAVLSWDETRILSWSHDKTVRLWDVATGLQVGPSMIHDVGVVSARLSRDGTRIVSSLWKDSTIWLWDATTGRQIGAMAHDDLVLGALLSRDGTRILSWSRDKTLRLWDAATDDQIGPSMTHDGSVRGAVLSRDETRIVSWSDDKTVRLWNVATGPQIGLMTHDGAVNGALLSRDETRILSWSDDKTVRLWDVATGRQIGPSMKQEGQVAGAVLSRDETRILSWSWRENTVRLWDVATGRQIGPAMWHDGEVNGAQPSRDETRILSWSWRENTVRLLDVATGHQISPPMTHDDWVRGALLSRDETRILSWSRDKTVRLWDMATGRQIGPAMTHDGSVRGALLSRDETRILSWSRDKTVRLWDMATGHQIGPAMTHDGEVNGAQLSRDETRILSWSADKTLRLWDVATGRQIGLMTHDGAVNGALLSRDETRIVSWSDDKTVRLWDVETGRQIGPSMTHDDWIGDTLLSRDESGRQITVPLTHSDWVNGALLSRDETRILSWSHDKTVRLWDVATGRQIGPSMTHDDWVRGALLSRDETRILSWSRDKTLRLWDVATGRQIGPAMTHDDEVNGAVLSRDETRILSWSRDKTVRLWDMATGHQIGPAMTHDGEVNGAQLSRDEARVLSWSADGTVRIWDISWRGGNLFEIACNHTPPDHDLTHVSARYGIKIADPICQPDNIIPAP